MLRFALAIYAVMSLVALAAYALDKRAAGRGKRRTPERVLHAIDLLGGWPGGLAGVYLLRHKSAKVRFKVILWFTVILHLAGWVYFGFRR